MVEGSKSSSRPKRRGPKHPGVTLIKPSAASRTWWRARYEDPDTRRNVWETLDASLRTEEARRDWAVKRSRKIAQRRLELEDGAPRAKGETLTAAVDAYFADHVRLRPSTLALYRTHANALLEWARKVGIEKADELTREQLHAFRTSREKVKRRTSVAGGGKGEKVTAEDVRAPNSVNVELRAVRAVLGYLREQGLVSRLSSDDLRDALKRLDAPAERLEYLKPADLRRLLEAALKHDRTTFAATRAEHATGTGAKTPRYPAVAPFVAGVLLSGMRLDEALTLEWPQVDLDALDNHGKAVGEIALTTRTKTHKPREIALEVTPALRKLLAALKLRTGGKGLVFGLTRGEARAAMRRLPSFGAPEFTWQTLRQTCGSYLSNAPAIYGSAAAFHSAKQLGHSVQVAEKFYVGRVRGIPADARDLESAMQVNEVMAKVIASVSTGPRRAEVVAIG